MTQATFSLETPVIQQEMAPSLLPGRYTGVIEDIKIIDVKVSEDETKTRVVWTLATADGKAPAFSGMSATQNSKLFAVMTNLNALGRPLKELIGRKVGFTVSLSRNQKAKVDLATVTPA